MIISLNWLKQYVDIKIPTAELVELIGARLVEIEETIDLAPKYQGIKIVEVRAVEKIAGSDHLSKCQIWDGKEESQVVCGAPNVHAGMLAVWLAPGVTLPETYNSEPLVLAKRKIMGVESNGMLAALDELDLGADHGGIIEIDPEMTFSPNDSAPRKVQPGDDFAEVFGLNDTLLDIENKSLTHRPDTFGVIGFAREVAGILGQPAGDFLNNPDKNDSFAKLAYGDKSDLTVKIADPELCSRYEAVILDNFDEKPAKYLNEMVVTLAKSGMRTISPIVDVTNYLMLLTGQPLHAFDYDKLVKVGSAMSSRATSRDQEAKKDSSADAQNDTAHIIVRAAKNGERLELLDGRTIEMTEGDIVITSSDVPVALAGAMGGHNTDIDESTRRIVIESATFNLYNLRGTQFRHGIFSEAITRFTKGQPPALTDPVIDECTRILSTEHGMKIVGAKVDAYPKPLENPPIDITLKQINNLLGTDFTYLEFEKTLTDIGYKIWCDCDAAAKCECETVRVQAPWWRTDVHIPEDIIEDIGRINGYDNITPTLPTRDFAAVQSDPMSALKQKIREILASFGANEVLTYSFVSGDLLKKVDQDPANSYKIINSISPELQFIRQSLTPNLLEKTYQNLRSGFDNFALFEINQVFQKRYGMTEENVPCEKQKIALTLADKNGDGAAYYSAKKFLDELFSKLGIKAKYVPLNANNASNKPFEKKRSAQIKLARDEEICFGVVGEFRAAVLKNFKLPKFVAGFELNLELLTAEFEKAGTNYQPLAKYQGTSRDLTVQVGRDVSFADVENLIWSNLNQLPKNIVTKVAPVDIFAPDEKLKNITLRVDFADRQKTIDSKFVARVIDEISAAVTEKLKGKII